MKKIPELGAKKYPWHKLKKYGDSFIVPKPSGFREKNNLCNSIRQSARYQDKRVTIRQKGEELWVFMIWDEKRKGNENM